MENRFNDGNFLKRVVRELHPPLYMLMTQANGPIKIDSVGGKGQMVRAVKDKVETASQRSRLIAVVDSDKKFPDDQTSKEAGKLEEICQTYRVPCWILAKRESEIYLPPSLLKAYKRDKTNTTNKDHEKSAENLLIRRAKISESPKNRNRQSQGTNQFR